MAHQDTQSATPINKRERSSRGAPHGLNSDLWTFLRQCAWIAAVFAAVGVGAVWFLLLPRHEQAMIGYGAVLVLCASLAVAGLRRRTK